MAMRLPINVPGAFKKKGGSTEQRTVFYLSCYQKCENKVRAMLEDWDQSSRGNTASSALRGRPTSQHLSVHAGASSNSTLEPSVPHPRNRRCRQGGGRSQESGVCQLCQLPAATP